MGSMGKEGKNSSQILHSIDFLSIGFFESQVFICRLREEWAANFGRGVLWECLAPKVCYVMLSWTQLGFKFVAGL